MKAKTKRVNKLADAYRISSYSELESFVAAFAAGKINLIILVGEPGLAKSRTVKGLLPDACWIEGNASPFGMYLKLFEHRDRLVVIDDVDSLYSDRNGIRLLKCLCQTDEQKVVAWPTASRELKREGVPREFVTRSRVIIITNEWKTLNQNVAALQDRGHTLLFCPNAAEVHLKVSEWFTDEEIFSFLGEQLHRVDRPSMRLYHRALELKSSGLEWRAILPEFPGNARARRAAELLQDPKYMTQRARVEEFVKSGAGCRATFFNYARRLGHRHEP
ncbi:MAG: hypothetical protein KDB23_12390 [Planctomycetales bacterium]|nr:hypothetical protein [Planctomycetales bacterium]